MKTSRIALLVISSLFMLSVAAKTADSIGYFETIKKDADIKAGKTYYLRHNLMYERDTWDATNYWRGSLLPINTKVAVGAIGKNSMLIKWDGGSLTIENSKYTKKNMAALAKDMLASQPVPIEKFGEEMAQNISSGTMKKGMTREQIIMTRGHPPAHKTPSITAENAKWTYWTSRYATETLVISGGKLVEGRNVVP